MFESLCIWLLKYGQTFNLNLEQEVNKDVGMLNAACSNVHIQGGSSPFPESLAASKFAFRVLQEYYKYLWFFLLRLGHNNNNKNNDIVVYGYVRCKFIFLLWTERKKFSDGSDVFV